MKMNLHLNRLLSFSGLAWGYVIANTVKFYLYDIGGFNQHWTIKDPSLYAETSMFFELVFGGYIVPMLLAAAGIDKMLWPYFYRTEVKEIREIELAEQY
jgi:hypothetical protein